MNTPVALRGNGADAAAGASSFDELASRWAGGDDLDALVEALVAEMSDAEKLRLIEGDVDFWEGRLRTLQEGSNTHPPQAARCSRLGIPGIAFVDGPRGSAIPPANCFPVSMARGATFDIGLEEEIGRAIGRKVRAHGGDFFGGVCVNPAAPPRVGSRTGDVRRGRPRRGGDGRCPDQQVRQMMPLWARLPHGWFNFSSGKTPI